MTFVPIRRRLLPVGLWLLLTVSLAPSANGQTWSELLDSSLILERSHEFDSAIALGELALASAMGEAIPQDSVLAKIQHYLGRYNLQAARYGEAETYYKKSLENTERSLGPEDRHVANTLHSLASLYRQQARYYDAEQAIKRATRIYMSEFGPDDPNVAKSRVSLASIKRAQGKFTQAEELLKNALPIMETSYGQESQQVAILLNNLANLLSEMGRLSEAEPVAKRAISIWEKVLGPEHPYLATSLDGLAVLYFQLNRFDDAEPLYRRSLAITEKKLGPGHPSVSRTLGNLATLLLCQNKAGEAEPLYQRALSVGQEALTSFHPELAELQRCLGILQADNGDYSLAVESYRDMLDLRLDFAERIFSHSAEAQKLKWVSLNPLLVPDILSLALVDTLGQAKNLALEMVLKGKAVIIDAVMAEKRATYCSYIDFGADVKRHLELCTAIANLTLSDRGDIPLSIYRDSLTALYGFLDSLETELSRRCAEFRDDLILRKFNITDVANALSSDAILCEFVRFTPPQQKMTDYLRLKTGPPRYLALTLEPNGVTGIFDLGPVSIIDSLVEVARDKIYHSGATIYSADAASSEQRLAGVTADLYSKLLSPLSTQLEKHHTIFISPDGQLNLLPFEILTLPDGSYLIENYRVSYLSSGRDILKMGKSERIHKQVVAVAAPDYDMSASPGSVALEYTHNNLGMPVESSRSRLGNLDCISGGFAKLRFGRYEALAVLEEFSKVGDQDLLFLTGTEASEETLKKRTVPPDVLHIVTHGFFCQLNPEAPSSSFDNPLLRCGLALAGANRTLGLAPHDSTAAEDGILTALEVSGLNLIDTRLVTLSACESGLGKVTNGEGMFGLRRAFQHAGARTILTSLWQVSDNVSSELMTGFYKKWLNGGSALDALRESSLELLFQSRREHGHGHPIMWGGFVLTGNPF